MTNEEKAKRSLDALMRAGFERGLEQGFFIGKGRPPRPEEIAILKKVADRVLAEVENTTQDIILVPPEDEDK